MSGFRRDAWTALLLAAAGIGVRLAFVRAFPAAPRFDSQGLIAFGRVFHDRGLFPDTYYWTHFGPGVPLILSLLDGVFASNISAAARTATAVATGLLGVLPFCIWRSVLAYRWRLLAGLLLALWPGQVFFSGIVTQDNWVLLPGVALCALAVRVLRDRNERDAGRPVLATVLFLAAIAMRQEMLLVLLPPWLAAAVSGFPSARRAGRKLAVAAALAAAGILALAAQRFAATGRFTITTEHGGLAFLGSVIPQSFASGWINPRDYIAAVEPSLLGDPVRSRREAARLASAEIRRHPLFHALRAAAQAPHLALISDASNLDWSMTLPGALPAPIAADGERFRRSADLPLKIELGVFQGLAMAALLAGVWTHDRGLLVVALAAALKFMVHAVFAPVPRLMLPAIAFELLTIPLGAAALCSLAWGRRAALGAVAAAVPILLLLLTPSLEAAMMRFPQEIPRLTRFSLAIAGGGSADCALEAGKLICLEPGEARLETSDPDPSPGDSARVSCRLPPLADDGGEPPILRLEDTYAAGGWPDRMIARVFVDGRPRLCRDLAGEPGSGWIDVSLQVDSAGSAGAAATSTVPVTVTIEEVALRTDAGMFWGASAPLGFAFRRGVPSPPEAPVETVYSRAQ